MQSVAPAASFHDSSCLLIHNLDLSVDDNILVILIEHAVGFEQLLQRVYTFALHGVVVEHVVFLVETLLFAETCLVFECRELRRDVRKHEQVFVVHLFCEPFRTFVCEVAAVQFLVYHEIERFYSLRHAAVVVLHVVFLFLEHTGFYSFLRKIFDERLVLRQSLV